MTFNFFTARSSLLLYAFVWSPYICMEKMLIISNGFSPEASWPVLLKFHVEPPWVGEWKIAKMCIDSYSNDHAPLTVRPIYSSSKLRTAQLMIFSLVAMIGFEKCCITSACLQWLCHSGERIVARGPLVQYNLYIFGIHLWTVLYTKPCYKEVVV